MYRSALAEMARRRAPDLDLKKTIDCIMEAARQRRFISYKDLSDASGAKWDRVRYKMNKMLWDVVRWGHDHDWPMLSAIVVNKKHVETGMMEAETLAGFCTAAEKLGLEVGDREAFLRAQQQEIHDRAAAGERPPPGTLDQD